MDAELAHGYTLAQVHQLAKTAVNMAGVYASDYLDRLDTAYGAIVIHLYAAPHWPTRHQLVQAGATAVNRMVEKDLRQRGYRRGNGHNGAGSAPRFAAYWDAYLVAPSPENKIIERVAVHQVLPRLAPREKQALAALAATDDYQAAADMLDMPYSTFADTISRARRRIHALWHEGETPRRQRTDIRVGNRAKGRATHCRQGHLYPPETGAEHAHAARKRGRYCPACYQQRKADRLAGVVGQARVLRPCGTYAAWVRHRRHGTEVDAACQAARDDYLAAYREQQRRRQVAA